MMQLKTMKLPTLSMCDLKRFLGGRPNCVFSTGMGKEVENLLTENKQLLETK